MTVTDDPTGVFHRHEIVVTGGLAGVLQVGRALEEGGYRVEEFRVSARRGEPYTAVHCSIALPAEQVERFRTHLVVHGAAVSVETW